MGRPAGGAGGTWYLGGQTNYLHICHRPQTHTQFGC
jgi:hypothetical protein